jgi:hypothetical protein
MPAVLEIQAHAVVGRIVREVLEPVEIAGHAEMQGQPAAPRQPDEQMLAMPPGRLEPLARERSREPVGRQIAQNPGVVDLHGPDGLAECVPVEVALEQLDVGELGHRTRSQL